MARFNLETILSHNENRFLDLPFKGSREYVHSTDLYPALMEVARERFGPQAWVDGLTIRRPFRCIIQVSFEPVEVSFGSFRIRNGNQSIAGWLLETDTLVTRRIPYDTSPLSAAAVSGPGYARLLEPLPGFPVLDVLVVLMKQVAAQVDRRQWWLCQLNLDAPLTAVYPIEVSIRNNVGGRCLVFHILQASIEVGTSRFMLEGTNLQESVHVSAI